MLSIKIVVKADFVVLERVPGESCYLILYHIWEGKQWGNTKENLPLKSSFFPLTTYFIYKQFSWM